jgi:hypothetical protein
MMKQSKFILASLFAVFWVSQSLAQEITPRLFWPTPKGTKVLVAGYSYSEGNLFFDTSIPIEAADSRINMGIVAYAQTIDLWGRTSNILVNLPYAAGTARGLVNGVPGRRDFSAFGDLSMTLNVNLKGAPSMNTEEFLAFRAEPRTLFGASIKVIAPTGEYYSDRLVNVGANRWTTRLKLGAVHPFKRSYLIEFSASAWLFGDDDDFVSGKKEQDPIYSLETNLIKRIRPGLWASLDVTYYRGGRQTIGGEPLRNSQNNMKLGGTLVVPFLRRHAIKIGYANGVITRYGEDFDQVLASYQVLLN